MNASLFPRQGPGYSDPLVTDGEIAATNLESARRRAWARFAQDACSPGVAESIVDMERLRLQFLGHLDALDDLDRLAACFARVEHSFRSALVDAEVASAGHRFADARHHLSRAAEMGASSDDVESKLLTINQACGVRLDDVADARHRIAAASGRLEELVPLGAVLGDLERYDEADAVYQAALRAYGGTSPFAPAWVCFQLGMLWGELASDPDLNRAALWYERAIAYLPAYVSASVHLAEIYSCWGRADRAEELLLPALGSRDPEVPWRLSDVLTARGRPEAAATRLADARRGFEQLIAKHLLAFADHAAEFFAGSGDDQPRALELARVNAANRATRRAVKQVQAIVVDLKGRDSDRSRVQGSVRHDLNSGR